MTKQLKKQTKPEPTTPILTDEEEDACVPTEAELEAYLAEPDDTLARCLPPETKCLVAKGILYGKKVARAQAKKIAGSMISRANAGLDALPKDTEPYWEGYWKGLKDYGQELEKGVGE